MEPTLAGPRPQRSLAAVMFTDMVGYSSLTQKNESLALELLEEHRTIVREIIARYSGHEIETIGDAFFVIFGSALEATECAIDIQKALHQRNESVPVDRAILLRVGLHLGDVVIVGGNVHGDGVNIAARMEPLARPGSICISQDVARQVHNKIELPLEALGRRQLKNIHLPMDAYRVIMPWEEDPGGIRPFQTHEDKAKGSSGPARRSSSRQVDRDAPKKLTSSTWWYGVVLIAVVVAVALYLTSDREVSNQADGSRTASVLAVLPFSVQGSPDFAYLGRGMVDLLSTMLDGAGDLRAADPRAILGVVDQAGKDAIDPEDGREIAERLGAGSFVLGNIVEVGGRLRINAAVYSNSQEQPARQGTVEGEATDIFRLLDGLAAQLVVLDRTGPGAPIESLEEKTTSSFEALKHYLQGVGAFRAARFQEAAEELRLAVGEDSTFSLAWYQLSATADWLYNVDLGRHAAEQALRHAANLSIRGRRLVEALHAGKTGENRKAFELYRAFVATYPDDVEAWYQLGELQFHVGPFLGVRPSQSTTAWERLLYFEPDQITALIHLARIAASEKNYARLDSMTSRVFEMEPGAERNLELQSHIACIRGSEAMDDVTERLRVVDDDVLVEVIWSLASFRDELDCTSAILALLLEPSRSREARALGYLMQAYLEVARGRLDSANRIFDLASESGSPAVPMHRALLTVLPFRNPTDGEVASTLGELQRWETHSIPPTERHSAWFNTHDEVRDHLRFYLMGILASLDGDESAAISHAEWLDASTVPAFANTIGADLALAVRAAVAHAQGNTIEAEAYLDRQQRHVRFLHTTNSTFFAHSRERFVHGLLLEEREQYREAIDAMSFFEGYSLFDWIYIAPSHLHRARSYEALGDKSNAIEHYSRFLSLWVDCDEEFRPIVQDAQSRLSELQSLAGND